LIWTEGLEGKWIDRYEELQLPEMESHVGGKLPEPPTLRDLREWSCALLDMKDLRSARLDALI